MKPKDSSDADEPLREDLRAWTVTAPLPPRFEEQVWQRIAKAEAPSASSAWGALKHWLEQTLSRPSVALTCVGIMFATGVTTGYWQAHDSAAESNQNLRLRYVQAVDPYQRHVP